VTEGHNVFAAEPKKETRRMRLTALAGFALSAGYAIHGRWQLPELCWSFWVSGLGCCWVFVLVGGLRCMLQPVAGLPAAVRLWPVFATSPASAGRALIAVAGAAIGVALFHAYTWLFGFYGLFLSVFTEMEPKEMFGRNGFINSDFYTPVVYLLERYWPMALGTVVAEILPALTLSPWRAQFLPFSRQLVPIHVMVLGMPFAALFFWWVAGGHYQTPTVVLVLALFYFFPRREAVAQRGHVSSS
jgi:hypothetical protein